MSQENQRKKAFISYSRHYNPEGFVYRLGYSLQFYVDTYWDIKLGCGKWEPQLEQAIKDSEFFLIVMSVGQRESDACKWELNIAQQHNKSILPIQIYPEYQPTNDLSDLNWAVFTQGFDRGFREVTYHILGKALSPWESFAHLDHDDRLIDALGDGKLPGIIAIEIAEWVLINELWPFFAESVSEQFERLNARLKPRTMSDFYRAIKYMEEHSLHNHEFVGHGLIKHLIDGFEEPIGSILSTSDDDFHELGRLAKLIVSLADEFIKDYYLRRGSFLAIDKRLLEFKFNVTSIIRESILSHARRSRYLY